MKLKDGFILREVAGQTVVLPTGGDLHLNMMITLNETAKFLQIATETYPMEVNYKDIVLGFVDLKS